MLETHHDVLQACGATRLARILGENPKAVAGWLARNSIPGKYFVPVAAAAQTLGVKVSVEQLALMAAGVAVVSAHGDPSEVSRSESGLAAGVVPLRGVSSLDSRAVAKDGPDLSEEAV